MMAELPMQPNSNEEKNATTDAIKDEIRRRWREWLDGPGAPLTKCGFPEVVFQDELHWQDFLTHGYFEYYPGFPEDFSIADLTEEQARRALECLNRLIPVAQQDELDLPKALRHRLGLKAYPSGAFWVPGDPEDD